MKINNIKIRVTAFVLVTIVSFIGVNTQLTYATNFAVLPDSSGTEKAEDSASVRTMQQGSEGVVCPYDARQCPDGSWIGRTGPKCEFICADKTTTTPTEVGRPGTTTNGETSANKTSGLKKVDRVQMYTIGDTMSSTEVNAAIYMVVPSSGGNVITNGDEEAESKDKPRIAVLKFGSETIHIDLVKVRGWDPKTKEAVRARLAENDAKNDANDFGLSVALEAINHLQIIAISVHNNGGIDEDVSNIEITYAPQMRILGFKLPTGDLEATAVVVGGKVQTTVPGLPWYVRWFGTNTNEEEMENVATKLSVHTGDGGRDQ